MASFEQCQREYDAMTPYDHEDDLCPECEEGTMKFNDIDSAWVCLYCGYSEYLHYEDQDYEDVYNVNSDLYQD